jgi:glycosyltransferase involved in cell wall biosynthesis
VKIVFCLNHFLPQQVAGTEVYTFSLIKEMQRKGVDCLVLIPHYNQRKDRSYVVDGIRVIQYAEPSVIDRSLNMGKRPPDGLVSFRNILKIERPDLVHFQEVAGGNGMTLFHLKEVKAMGIRVVITFHLAGYTCRTGDLMFKHRTLCDGIIDERKCSVCFMQHKGYERISQPLAAASEFLYRAGVDTSATGSRIGTSLSFPFIIRALRDTLHEIADTSDKIVVLTKWYHNILLKNGVKADKLRLITQGLPLKKSGSEVQPPQSLQPLRLIFIGRITPLKGVHLLIEALKTMDRRRVSLHIYGSSTDSQYERECKIASVSMPNVKWMGQLEQAQVIATMQRYHALCLPSTFSEMSPLVIQEAFAAGIPVIASDIYGNAEQVKDGENGLLFAFNNAEALRERIGQLLEQPGLLEKLRKGISQPKSFACVADEYENLYQELIPVIAGPGRDK